MKTPCPMSSTIFHNLPHIRQTSINSAKTTTGEIGMLGSGYIICQLCQLLYFSPELIKLYFVFKSVDNLTV